ncbi:hypothetical protein Msi02_71750 [Microbispora siamensis]|uniref:Uncharacterized protein n=1 Tax=Microbispora siamensis TaxID=564413 RepID=A0ABQ4GY60_9ACTN|nr:hypothetical protein Msi02_71750 [Microbispora siamensis]
MPTVPPPPHAVVAAFILAGLAIGLALIGFRATDISQIMSQVTALVALYVVKQGPTTSTLA